MQIQALLIHFRTVLTVAAMAGFMPACDEQESTDDRSAVEDDIGPSIAIPTAQPTPRARTRQRPAARRERNVMPTPEARALPPSLPSKTRPFVKQRIYLDPYVRTCSPGRMRYAPAA